MNHRATTRAKPLPTPEPPTTTTTNATQQQLSTGEYYNYSAQLGGPRKLISHQWGQPYTYPSPPCPLTFSGPPGGSSPPRLPRSGYTAGFHRSAGREALALPPRRSGPPASPRRPAAWKPMRSAAPRTGWSRPRRRWMVSRGRCLDRGRPLVLMRAGRAAVLM